MVLGEREAIEAIEVSWAALLHANTVVVVFLFVHNPIACPNKFGASPASPRFS